MGKVRSVSLRGGLSVSSISLHLLVLLPILPVISFPVSGDLPFASAALAPRGSLLSLQVDDIGDAPDSNIGDGLCQTAGGVCTLRAAMQEVLLIPGSHTILINVAGTIQLSGPLPTINNNQGLTSLTLTGLPAGSSVIRRDTGGNYQIFSIQRNIVAPMSVTLNDLSISNANSFSSGGAISSQSSDLILNRVSFIGNTSPNGSAIRQVGANLSITGSSFSGNAGAGATIAFETTASNNFSLSNSTISDNTSSGVYLALGNSGNAELISCTISSNNDTGLYFNDKGGRVVTLRGNIFAGHPVASLSLNGSGSFSSLGSNLASDGGGGYLTGTGDLINTNPLLAPLASYGGTTMTRALLRGSPAIDSGTAVGTPTSDQRGIARVGTPDIGAFESRGFQLSIAGGDNQVALTGSSFATPLAVTITPGDSGVPVTGAPVVFTPPLTGASAVITGSPATVTGTGATTGTVTANGTDGSYLVSATTAGIGLPVSFNLRNNNAPVVLSIVRSMSNPTTSTSLAFAVTLSEPLTGLSTGNFGLGLINAPGATISSVSGAGTNWVVNVSTGVATGRIGLNLVNSTGVNDGDGAPLSNLPFTGEVYSIAPRVVSILRNGASPTNAATPVFNVTLSESISGLAPPNFSLVASGLTGAVITSINGSGSSWAVTVSSGTGSGTLGLNLTSTTGVFDSDGISLSNLPFAGEVYVIDLTPPETTIISGPPATTPVATATFSFSGSDAFGLSGYQCRVDGSLFGSCSSPVILSALSVGLHTFEVRAVDLNGNVDPSPARFGWTVNNLPHITGASIELIASGNAAAQRIATVSDPDQSVGSLTVTATLLSGAGVSISSISIDPGGEVTALLQAECTAVESTYRLTVTDTLGGSAIATLKVLIRRQALAGQGNDLLWLRESGISCMPPGPGSMPASDGAMGGLKPGSLLIFNLYTSGTTAARSDSRLALTNTSPTGSVTLHLFFVAGQTGSVADSLIELTPNETTSFLASDIDPDTTGYLIAVAVDRSGCPVAFNHLIGEALVRVESGHAAALTALPVAVVDPAALTCDPGAPTVELRFDGARYEKLPRALAVSSLPSSRRGLEPLLIINRIGGSLVEADSSSWSLAGLLFDDLERGASFTMTGTGSQLRGLLGQNYPRTSPRYETLIPAGRTGWMRFAAANEVALSGAVINRGPDGFDQGRNLHLLTTTGIAVLTMPILVN